MAVVLHLGLVPILSGVQNVMLQILQAIESDAYEIIVASAPNGELVDEVKRRGWKHIPIPSLVREINPKLDWLAAQELAKVLKEEKVDILHTHSSKTGLIGRIVGRITKVPTIIHTVHGYPFHKYQNRALFCFYQFAERFAGKFCDYLVSVNEEDAEIAHQVLKIPKHKIRYIPNGAIPQKEHNILQKNEIVIGSLSRFWKQKNMINTVKIGIKACQFREELKFIFVGDGEDLSECKNLVETAGLSERILFPGWSLDKDKWLNSFDVFLLYSLWEGLPLSILEAMSYGLPIIASDIKGNRELVDNSNGYLVKAESESDLLNLFLGISSKRDELILKGQESYKKIVQNYSMDYFNERYKTLYKEIKIKEK